MQTTLNGTTPPAHPHTPIHFAHELGHLEGRLAALEQKVDRFDHRVEARLNGIETKLDTLAAALNFGRGGWKALAVLAAIAGAALALVKDLR